ncbi:MAG: phage Gp37/Gp68 family protein [Ignavibacteriota bacterium]|jgi:protein gp37|nr:MAG: phage Gp37/Gp68 family protein [Chlorobiota bacterium]MBE7476302.1 phage Gp37/Gp68 family protein [Ignavibacteriales bacterium]MBL1124216.1 phage Gp37/Gp68 family protein [Ignavibacteriota bacterium]MCC7094409.1 phage Gp37/Gp68 family protein [Ignavibacteriaceae bacterium]MCE7857564.1 phage Gp37/Gp68 family protein [Ignavibacteria bacterium CHB3]
MKTTKIEWTEKVWNPSIGCDKISAGCKFCYAEVFARRLKAIGVDDYTDGFMFKILPHRLEEPLKVKKPTKFFVNSMSDLFHEEMPFEYLDMIFNVIKKTPQHIYQILTKRDKIMLKYFFNNNVPENVWLGVSVESSTFNKRINSLKKVNAKIRFISFEPLINSVGELDLKGIHWAIVGGESGRSARPIKTEWVEEIFQQCKKQNIAFFFKQWGTWGADEIKRNKKVNGRKFRSKEWNEYPLITF